MIPVLWQWMATFTAGLGTLQVRKSNDWHRPQKTGPYRDLDTPDSKSMIAAVPRRNAQEMSSWNERRKRQTTPNPFPRCLCLAPARAAMHLT